MEKNAARRTGALVRENDSVLWRLWAPLAKDVYLVLIDGQERRVIAMVSESGGYHVAAANNVRDGQLYAYRLDGGPERPDPCSLWQPGEVDGPSAVVFPDRFSWTDQDWRGVRQADLVFYETSRGHVHARGHVRRDHPAAE